MNLDTIESVAQAGGTADPPTVLAACGEVRRLRTIAQYASHTRTCLAQYHVEPCSCGYDAALRGTP